MGMSEPWQVASYEDSPYYNERLAHEYLEYDPERANRLLDEMGLDKRGPDGFRLRPDGKKLQITLLSTTGWNVHLEKIAEIVTDNLRAVGLDVNLKIVDSSLILEKRAANDIDAVLYGKSWGTNEGAFFDGMNAGYFVPCHSMGVFYAPLWNKWYLSRGKEGEKPVPDMLKAIEYYREAISTVDPKKRKELWRKITDIAADNLWTIGTVKFPGYLKVISPNLENFPTEPKPWDRGGDAGRVELWFFKK